MGIHEEVAWAGRPRFPAWAGLGFACFVGVLLAGAVWFYAAAIVRGVVEDPPYTAANYKISIRVETVRETPAGYWKIVTVETAGRRKRFLMNERSMCPLDDVPLDAENAAGARP